MEQNKTEKPTRKKLRDARKKGEVAVSRDANSVAVYLAGSAAAFLTMGAIGDRFRTTFSEIGALIALDRLEPAILLSTLDRIPGDLMVLMAPLMAAVVVAGAGMGLVQARGVLSAHPMRPKLERVSPLRKLKQWFSVVGLFEFAKAILKLLTVFLVAYVVVGAALATVLRLGYAGPVEILRSVGDIGRRFLLVVGVVFAGFAILDFLFQRWNWMRNLKMTKHEVKRELKDTEGDPQIKLRRRTIHQELVFQDLAAAVSGASAVLVNPTHLAVAVRYERGKTPAPMILAKGRDRVAKRIVELAERRQVPVVQNVPLARSLFEVERGQYIPKDLYGAVAEVLTFVYRLERQGRRPVYPFWSR